jgi:heterodisulfide reductase subunit A2
LSAESKPPQALVIGAGIAGIKSALDLAEAGVKVHVCDTGPYIGGSLMQMEKWFPDNHCGLCQTLPVFNRDLPSQYCLRRGFEHPNITFNLASSVEKVSGQAGKFTATIRQEAQPIDASKCTGCGLCAGICPITSEGHKAVSMINPRAPRKTYVIDNKVCNRCGDCIQACPAGAIDFDSGPQSSEIQAGAIIVSTGFEEFDPQSASQYGYRRYPNVITGLDLERMLDGNSPSSGRVLRPFDGKAPSSVAFIQCVGSRDNKNDYCSSTCCMYAAREAGMVREQNKDAVIEIFCMDMRSFGKGHQRYVDKIAGETGVKFTRGRVPVVRQDFSNRNLMINRIDESGKVVTSVFDMVVLSTSQRPSAGFKQLGRILDISLNKWGFAATENLAPEESSRPGIFVCGSATGPRDIADSITSAAAAAGMALSLLKPLKSRSNQASITPAGSGIAAFFCNCNKQVSRQIDLEVLKEFARKLPGVKAVEEFDNLCLPEQVNLMKEAAKKSGANALVICACSAFRPVDTIENKPVYPVNMREELVWPARRALRAY